MSRIFNRPMFRRGGSTNNGITSGLRQGYREAGNVAQGAKDYINLVEGLAPSRGNRLNELMMNWGLNMVSNPPSGNILQTAATEMKEPLQQFQQAGARERAGRRDLVVAYLNTLDDDERTRLAKEVDYLMETDPGRFPNKEAALLHLEPEFIRYRKDQGAEETAREAKERFVKDLKIDPVTKIKRWEETTAMDIADAWYSRPEKDSEGNPYDYDTQLIAIEEEDVKKGDIDIETGVMTISDPVETYTDGTTYFDYLRKKWYTYQNGKFLPVNPS